LSDTGNHVSKLGDIHWRGRWPGDIDPLPAQEVLLTPAKSLPTQDDMQEDRNKTPKKRREHPVFTLFVHIGYTILILSMIFWIVYIEFIL
jgi:hypothetical protein